LFNFLHSAGRDEAEKWLSIHRASVGRKSSVDLKAHFLTPSDGDGDVPASDELTGRAERKRAVNSSDT
jgi:hypothetical protein